MTDRSMLHLFFQRQTHHSTKRLHKDRTGNKTINLTNSLQYPHESKQRRRVPNYTPPHLHMRDTIRIA